MRGRKLPQSSLRDASPLGDGAFGMAGRFLIAIDTLATELTACALSVTCGDSSPKGRAKSTAGSFLLVPNTLATNVTAWLSLRGKTSPAPGEDVTVGDKRGNLARERLRGFKSAEPEKTVKRSSRRTGVNLQFFPVQPTSLGLKGASSPFFVAPARRNRWHFSGSLLVSKENIPGSILLPSPLFHMEQFTSPRRRWGCGRCTRCSRPSLPGGRWRARRCRSSAGWRGRWC